MGGNDDCSHRHDNMSKGLDITPHKIVPYKADLSVEPERNNDNALARKTVLNHPNPTGNKNPNIDISVKTKRKIISKVESLDVIKKELQSKLLFIRRISSDKAYCQICQTECKRRHDSGMMKSADNYTCEICNKNLYRHNINKASKSAKLTQQIPKMASSMTSRMQDESTLTQEMFCPCACGLLMGDENEDELSIESLSTLKEKLIKTKLHELGLYRDPKEGRMKTHSDIKNIRETKMQEHRNEIIIESSVKEEITQLKLQIQAKELRRNIQFIKEENEYLRHFVEKCHCSSAKENILLQLLPIEATYTGFTATIEFLRTRCSGGNGIIATLTEMFRGSLNVRWIIHRLLAPFVQR